MTATLTQHVVNDSIDILLAGINKLSGNTGQQFLEFNLFFIFCQSIKVNAIDIESNPNEDGENAYSENMA
jgi:hypothetical protein